MYNVQFLNVYAPKYETAGKFWPIAHSCMIFSLLLMHAIAVGIFTLKGLPLASTLVVPLPILTLLFNEYCRKRFLPNFSAYSAEVSLLAVRLQYYSSTPSNTDLNTHIVDFQALITKDREDQNDPAMAEFFDKLVTAYGDPALMPVSFTTNADSLNRPLMSED